MILVAGCIRTVWRSDRHLPAGGEDVRLRQVRQQGERREGRRYPPWSGDLWQ